jgi:uncharacterized metal-binding protein YceD (DUF177 family)
MRISTNLINDNYVLTMTNNDPWLSRIATDLAPTSPQSAEINGQLALHRDQAGFVHVTGSVSAQALLPCDRCGQVVTMPLTAEITAKFRPPFASVTPREMALSQEDMDTYFLENDCVDIEQLINDAVQCAIPSQIRCTASPECQGPETTDGSDELVYADQVADDAESPFAVLKDFQPS